ncbi:MAG: aldo/keto reductase [Anaerolineae bacterium]|nr:aldo/keto reductase [Anaerolineae bacterium]
MAEPMAVNPTQIGAHQRKHAPLAMGGSTFGPNQYTGDEDANLLGALEAAYERGITHFDTAEGYGGGHSERLIGRFIAASPSRRNRLFLASKANLDDLTPQSMLKAIEGSLARMQTDVIDLYYIHWPRTGKDMRPVMEGLEVARQQGKIRSVGVSNFSVEQMEQVGEVGRIDAHQLAYNLFWRVNERDVIPYCNAHYISIVTYASLAHGILAGRIPQQPDFPKGDQRNSILLFREDIWPQVYAANEAFKAIAAKADRPLAHLAIRWLLRRSGVSSVVVSARNAQQANANADALYGDIPDDVFAELTAVSDAVNPHIPFADTLYNYNP